MSKYSSIVSATDMGTYEDFIELFKEGEQYEKDYRGRTLLSTALVNTKPEEKYKIANFLIIVILLEKKSNHIEVSSLLQVQDYK